MSKTAKKVSTTKPKPTKQPHCVLVQVPFSDPQFIALCAISAHNSESVPEFVKRATLSIADVESDTIGMNLKEGLKP